MTTLIYRNHKAGFSIGKVFDIIAPYLKANNKIEVPSARDYPWSVLRNLCFIFFNRNKKGVNHITGDIHYGIFALIGCRSLLTIHDLVMVHNQVGVKRYIKGLIWVKLPVRIANHVTCISDKTRNDILKYTGCPESKVTVVHNAYPQDYEYVPANYGRVILHIGTRKNKNLKRVIEALEDIDCSLRIIGEIDDETQSLLEKKCIQYSNAYNLSDDEIKQEYINCDIVSFPSLYEGFGMPIIEGQAIGRPVLTSNIPPMNEIANGNNVVMVDPYSVKSIRDGFIKLLDDMELRNHIIKNGLLNATKYTCSNIAEQYNNLYLKIINEA